MINLDSWEFPSENHWSGRKRFIKTWQVPLSHFHFSFQGSVGYSWTAWQAGSCCSFSWAEPAVVMRYSQIPTIMFQLTHKIPQTHASCLPHVQTWFCLIETGVQFLKQQIWLQRSSQEKSCLWRWRFLLCYKNRKVSLEKEKITDHRDRNKNVFISVLFV